MNLAPGYALTDNLRIEHALGSGAMGSVYAARNLALDALVAVKVMSPAIGRDEALLDRFRQEARASAKVKSPHAVQVFEFGVTRESEPFLVMELLEGEDLGRRLKREGALGFSAAREIVAQTLQGLEALHAARVVHRDIKPANLFLLDIGGRPFVKILDFGIAKLGAEGVGLTKSGAALGTPLYMSPEQLVSPRSVDHRSDLWAVAVVAYQCMTGRVPFDGETLGAITVAIHEARYASANELVPNAPAGLDAWFAGALAKDPAERFAAAREMREALAALVPLRLETPLDRGGTDERSLEQTSSPSEAAFLGQLVAAPAQTPAASLVGATLGRYRVLEILGQGGMGVVFAAEDTLLRRRVALKVLLADRLRDAAGRSRFLREARSAAKASHPGIAGVFEVGEAAGHVFIAMELVRGKSLRAALNEHPSGLPAQEVLRIGREVAKGLAHAHGEGVIHRDLKPENLMLAEDGSIKILDFGVAKLRDTPEPAEQSSATSLATQEGWVLGTPSYMSPEQAKGMPVDERTDVFSLGVVLYELTTGRRPFTGATRMEIAIAIDRDRPPSIATLSPSAPAALVRAIERCLEKRPEHRYPTCRELSDDLCELAETPARPHGVAPARASRRWRLGLGALALASALAVAFAWPRLGAERPIAAAPAPGASGSTSPAPSAEAAPVSTVPEAVAAYRAALQAARDVDDWTYEKQLEAALSLDPTMAAAHVRMAAMNRFKAIDAARVSYQRASQNRARLSERDRAYLDALEATVVREPIDARLWVTRIEAATKSFPGDSALLGELAFALANLGDLEASLATYTRAIEVDPGWAHPYLWRGWVAAYLGRFDDARADIARGCQRASSSTLCAYFSLALAERDGDCGAQGEAAKRWAAGNPEDPRGYAMLARAAHARGEPLETSEELLKQAWSRLPEKVRRTVELTDRIDLCLLRGDFVAAEQRAHELEAIVANDENERRHAHLAMILLSIRRELGRAGDAARVAQAFESRRAAWLPDPRLEIVAMGLDITPSTLAAMARGGALDPAAHEAKLDAWIAGWDAKAKRLSLRNPFPGYLWLYGIAAAVETPAEAAAALRRLDRFSPLPPFRPYFVRPMNDANAALGKVLALAGRHDEAIPVLQAATRSCRAFELPMQLTQASYFLGTALEAKGSRGDACAAYKTVLDRWGAAKPMSVTADLAKARFDALKCRR